MKFRYIFLASIFSTILFSTLYTNAQIRPVFLPGQTTVNTDTKDKSGTTTNDAANDPRSTSQKDPSYSDTKKDCSGADCNVTNTSDFKLQVRLDNPLKVKTISEAIGLFMNIILKIALPIIVLFFIWAGLKFILALGKPDKLKEARMMLWYTIIGTLLVLGAWTITNAIIGTVNSLTS